VSPTPTPRTPAGPAGSALAPTRHEPDELLVGFARALRAAGVPVTQDRTRSYLEAASLVGLDDQRATYWAGRATLCSGPDDLDRYDQVFTAWFHASDHPVSRPAGDDRALTQAALGTEESLTADEGDDDLLRAMASESEVLRHRDIADMPMAEKARLAALFETLRPRPPRRSANRRTPWHRGDLDAQRTLRQMLRRMGEPGEIAWRRRATRPRRVVLLVDVSGSMSAYADSLLRLAHRFSHPGISSSGRATARVEVFTVGTRLTRLTPAMRMRDPERAIVAAGETVPDWSGGTRLGETLRIFMDRWGQRGLARGAVVVVFSDGWERGDAGLLGEQMRRLHGVAHRVVWVNPHVGKDGYLPVQQGIVAALPYVDDLVAGHSLATFADLIEVVARA
jgi:uncharacterized protein with von Willebrand factor type A (vWA) domain